MIEVLPAVRSGSRDRDCDRFSPPLRTRADADLICAAAILSINCRETTSDERDFLFALQAAAACDVAALGERAGQLTRGRAPIRTSLALGWLAALVVDDTGRPASALLN